MLLIGLEFHKMFRTKKYLKRTNKKCLERGYVLLHLSSSLKGVDFRRWHNQDNLINDTYNLSVVQLDTLDKEIRHRKKL